MKRPFMVWIGFISICCSKVAKEGKSCPRLLVLQRVAQNVKSCSKVAEHNLFMPIGRAGEVLFLLAREQQTHFRSSLLSLSLLPPSFSPSPSAIFRRERSDDRKCVCCSQARFLSMVDWVEYEPFVAKKKRD